MFKTSVVWFAVLMLNVELCAQQKKIENHSLNEKVLQRLIDRAKKSESDALIIWQNGKPVKESYFGKKRGRIESMSATKSVVALAFGLLIADGKLKSLDEPVYKFYPEWNQGQKSQITIFHLLTQRSGLQSARRTTAIYRSPNFVQLALCAELTDKPGSKWRYNNKGCNLLPGIVQKISGQRMDKLIGERIFKPLGISDWSWSLDKSGNPHGMSGLQIRPEDLVKIGQLMMDGGQWKGQQILPKEFVSRCISDQNSPGKKPKDTKSVDFQKTKPEELAKALGYGSSFGPSYGLLWWINVEPQVAVTDRLLALWKSNDVDPAFLKKMAKLKGFTGDALWKQVEKANISEREFMSNIVEKGQLDWDVLGWQDHGYSAEGYLGQYLVVVPKHRIVAVRMRRSPRGKFDERKIDSFKDFKKLVAQLGKREE